MAGTKDLLIVLVLAMVWLFEKYNWQMYDKGQLDMNEKIGFR